MKIGLMRHFRVQAPKSRALLNSNDFTEWINQYNTSDIVYEKVPKNVQQNWDYCFSSDMLRAVNTAQHIYKKEIFMRNQLKEIDMSSLFHTQLKLPLVVWLVLGRLGWLFNHSNQEPKLKTMERAREILTEIETSFEDEARILVVSHGAFMTVLSRELLKRGYSGRRINRPKNGSIYTFEKKYEEGNF